MPDPCTSIRGAKGAGGGARRAFNSPTGLCISTVRPWSFSDVLQGPRAHWSAENTAMHLVRLQHGVVFIDEHDLVGY